jgi:thiamine biosynthesis lipoprotein
MTIAVRPASALARAQEILEAELDAIGHACSRFRPDAEIWGLSSAGGAAVAVSPLLFDLVATACDVAERTGGCVDPTVGRSLEALGYDRDFASIDPDGPGEIRPEPAPGWWTVTIDHHDRTIAVPPGVHLDLGATAKALAADRIAVAIASDTGASVLVALGGDVAVAGPVPVEGWPVGIATDSATPVSAVDTVVALFTGGLATSSTAVRTWNRGGRRLHHIVDPATGMSVAPYWRTVSVAAGTCVDANAGSTAAMVWGEDAPDRLEGFSLAARLVRDDGTVHTTKGWPDDGGPDDDVPEDDVVGGKP